MPNGPEKARKFEEDIKKAEKRVREAFPNDRKTIYFDDFVEILGFSRPVVAQYIHALEKRGKIAGEWEIVEEGGRRKARRAYSLAEDV